MVWRFRRSAARRPSDARAGVLASKTLRRRVALPVVLIVAGGLLSAAGATTPANPASCANPIVCENELPGTPESDWDMSAGEGTTIQGFADPFSVPVGGTINFKIDSSVSSYSIDIYRMGYYGGDGARLIASLTPNMTVSENQPPCNTNTVTGLVDCGNWGVSASWTVPSTAVSGVYFAHIYTATDDNQIPFVVTDPSSTADVVFMTSDETWEAYNQWGGYSLYTGDATGSPWSSSALDPGRAVQVSYNRPFTTRWNTDTYGQDFFFSDEFPMIEFLEENGYNVTYVSQSDVSQPGAASMLEQHKVFMTAGHSEYWDAGDVANVTAARNAGVNLAFFSGNLMWWKTRWASSQYGNESYRTLITYKESLDTTQDDPDDPPTWTGEWRDPRFMASGDDSGQPENALTGQLWMVNCCSYNETVTSPFSQLGIWKNTAAASLQSGQTYTMPDETLGYEWDEDVDNGFRPAGEIDLSKTCETDVQQVLQDPQEDIAPGDACNSLTLYRASSGALVFDAGTVQWAWGLNAQHDTDEVNTTDPVMQQATINLLAMMGVQPATLMAGMKPGVQPDYTSPPTSTITSPPSGSTFANGQEVTISGTATDTGGGVVAGVEVSTDGGSSWHPVTTMSAASTSVTWSYTWSAAGDGPITILSRATDDDANTETPGPGVSVTVGCPCSLFGDDYTPSVTSSSDQSALELGVKFQSSVAGWVDGVRFYKGAGNDGTHTGSLWTADGTLLATGTFTNETTSGWQSMTFANPVEIDPNTTYVVSYWDPDGHYSSDSNLFDWPLSTPPLTAVQANYVSSSGGNGVYNLGGQAFPTQTYNGSNYAVDVIFDTTEPPGAPPALLSVSPYPGSSSNPVTTDPTATFTKSMDTSTLSFDVTDPAGNTVAGATSFNATDTIATFTPSSSLDPDTTYTVTVNGAQDNFGETLPPYTYSFTTSQAYSTGGSGTCPCTIWPDTTPSSAGDASDAQPVTLGLEFQATSDGEITGVRFYKEPDDTGTHIGSLWTSSGQLLATGTFSNESTEGWQELDFSTPVAVNAGQTYVASYFTSTGHYAVTPNDLSSPVTSGPLTAVANGGVYAYGSGNTFPSSSYDGSNYWVDVVYGPNQTPPTASPANPIDGQTSLPTDTGVSFSFNEPVQSSSISFTLTGPGGVSVPGTLSYDSSDNTAMFVPSGDLTGGSGPLSSDTTYTATVSAALSAASGTAMSGPDTWSFTTAQATPPPGQCPCQIWPDSTQPVQASSGDTQPVNVGVQFTPDENGTITGIRFYKGVGNTGTHVGSLWDQYGDLLGRVTFTDESVAGWQQANFATPVPVTAGETYTASYLAPNGGYAADAGALSSAVTSGPLTALADGGVYAYNSSSAFPTQSYDGTNYWVDVVFAPNTTQCPCSIWSPSSQPVQASSSDTQSVNVGVQFTSDENGWITGIKFYKGPDNTGTHVGSLWDSSGNLLGQVTFTNETASGWQEADFSTPIAVTAGETYTASYLAPYGGYAADAQSLSSPVVNGPLTALASGGVYIYGSSSADPVFSWNSTNYWVDVVFTATNPQG
jgi:Domain of unknown function (DUF4082)/Bacterial Ig-like domain/Bacterial Ig domain